MIGASRDPSKKLGDRVTCHVITCRGQGPCPEAWLGSQDKLPGNTLSSSRQRGRCAARSWGKSGRFPFSIKGAPSHFGLKPWHQRFRASPPPIPPQPTHPVILCCKRSFHSSSRTHTFLCLPTASSLVQVPTSPFLAPVRASVQLPCPHSWPLPSAFHSVSRLAPRLGSDYKTATRGQRASDRGSRAALTCLGS